MIRKMYYFVIDNERGSEYMKIWRFDTKDEAFAFGDQMWNGMTKEEQDRRDGFSIWHTQNDVDENDQELLSKYDDYAYPTLDDECDEFEVVKYYN